MKRIFLREGRKYIAVYREGKFSFAIKKKGASPKKAAFLDSILRLYPCYSMDPAEEALIEEKEVIEEMMLDLL